MIKVKPAQRKTAYPEAIYARNRKAIGHFGFNTNLYFIGRISYFSFYLILR